MPNRVNNNFDNQVDSYLSFLQNEYVAAAVSLFLILYAGVIAPKLSPNILSLFDNWVVQIAMFFAIVYISKQNATVALIAAVAVLVTLMVVNSRITIRIPQSSEQFCAIGSSSPNHSYESNRDFPACGMNRVGIRINEHDVDGIMDDSIEEVDHKMACFRNAVSGGAITSMGGPKMQTRQELENSPETETKHEIMQEEDKQAAKVVGIEQTSMDEEVVGSSLDETKSMGSENASVKHDTRRLLGNLEASDEAVKTHVETVTSEVEQNIGAPVSSETQEEVMGEVKQKVADMIDQGRLISGFDVIAICREIYRQHF